MAGAGRYDLKETPWHAATLACRQNLGAASGGVTSCHIALAGMADSAVGQHAVLVSAPSQVLMQSTAYTRSAE